MKDEMMDFNELSQIPIRYDSPIIVSLVDEMSKAIAEYTDDGVLKAVVRAGFDIDKEKLVQILQQDKERYSEAFKKGYEDGYKKRENEIIRCRDCVYWESDSGLFGRCRLPGMNISPGFDWYCCEGVKRDDECP